MSDNTPLLSAPSARPGWHRQGPLRRYLSQCALIVLVGLAILGVWTASRLQQMVETEVGHRAATVLESMLNRHAGDLTVDALPPQLLSVFDAYFRDISSTLGVTEMKIWSPGGRVLYASRDGLTGQVLPVSPELEAALAGEISVGAGHAFHADPDQPAATTGPRLFEIYVPIRINPRSRVVAVAEYYQNAAVASAALSRAHWQTWMMLAIVGAMFVTVLLLILRHGDAVITRQHSDLSARVADLIGSLDQSRESQTRISQQARRQQEDQTARMRQINADIHDGIGQLLTVALLRIKPDPPSGDAPKDSVQSVRLILEEAMSEVQALLNDTSQIPQPELPLARAIATIVQAHCRRTSTVVRVLMADDLPEPGLLVKVAICRLVQEGLHNAFKHAGGHQQQLCLQIEGGRLIVAVSNDRRPGQASARDATRPPMGLRNLRHRIEKLGGSFEVIDRKDRGVEIRASFDEVVGVSDHG